MNDTKQKYEEFMLKNQEIEEKIKSLNFKLLKNSEILEDYKQDFNESNLEVEHFKNKLIDIENTLQSK